MNNKKLFRSFTAAILLGSTLLATAFADNTTSVIIGRDDWLFTRYEFAHPSDAEDTQASIQLLQKVANLFERNNIGLVLAIVPSKIRIHADHLPSGMPLDDYTAEKYNNVVTSLRSGGVQVANLNQAFLNSPHRNDDTPLFFPLDTHWSYTGALLAAETIKAQIDISPALKNSLAATSEEKYRLVWSSKKIGHRARDLVRMLAKGDSAYPLAQVRPFNVSRASASQADLLGPGENVGITVIGSSYTHKNTGYPDALRYTLQRNLLDISIPVDQGPWVGMETYLKDESYKTNKPKLIIWEIPEREMRSPPNYKFRDPRYIVDNEEWLARVKALIK